MERNNGKIIALVALVVAVIGLSIGFAAFSTQLSIGTAANVNSGAVSNWNVGFSTDGTGIVNSSDDTSDTVSGTTGSNDSNGTLTVTKYTLSQATNATLDFDTNTSVSYTLYIKNKGTATAYLDKVDFGNVSLTCTNVAGSSSSWIEGSSTAGTLASNGNTSTISSSDCATLFSVSLSINGTPYSTTASNISGVSIAGGASVPVVLTLSYNSSNASAVAIANSLDGDITVSAGTIVVDYKSTANAGS